MGVVFAEEVFAEEWGPGLGFGIVKVMDPGLCAACRYRKAVVSARGTEFSSCLRYRTDRAYPKYPRLPMLRCDGFEGASVSPAGASVEHDKHG